MGIECKAKKEFNYCAVCGLQLKGSFVSVGAVLAKVLGGLEEGRDIKSQPITHIP